MHLVRKVLRRQNAEWYCGILGNAALSTHPPCVRTVYVANCVCKKENVKTHAENFSEDESFCLLRWFFFSLSSPASISATVTRLNSPMQISSSITKTGISHGFVHFGVLEIVVARTIYFTDCRA